MKTAKMDSQISSSNWPYMSSANSVHFTSIFYSMSNSIKVVTHDQWILDSGATDHITPHYHLLYNAKPCNATLALPNGQTSIVTHIGSVKVSSVITMHSVLCVPSFSYNLLSIKKLIQNSPYNIVFNTSGCCLQDPIQRRSLEIGNSK